MQFKVPQFLDIEDKIFGPFTFSEFAYLVGGGGLCFVLYKALDFIVAIIPMILIASFSLALVFYKPNDKPFVYMLEAAIRYYLQDKLFIWKKKRKKNNQKSMKVEEKIGIKTEQVNKLSGSKLRDLAWSLDILDLKKENTHS